MDPLTDFFPEAPVSPHAAEFPAADLGPNHLGALAFVPFVEGGGELGELLDLTTENEGEVVVRLRSVRGTELSSRVPASSPIRVLIAA